MAEYIEREALMENIESLRTVIIGLIEGKGILAEFGIRYRNSILRAINEFPAADVAPVVHGRWIPCDPDSDVRFYCSLCGAEISTSWDYDCDEMWNGCPHCLARMDGE